MDTTVADPLLGALIDGRYRVRSRVARGGMATVYTATDERLERLIALKVMHPAQATDPRFVERFTNEAKTIARLTHPNVVAVYDQGSHNGLAYLVMEYVRGRSLRELLTQRGRLQPTDALAILEQVLAAVAAAHRVGLVHRDVKPENVLIAEAPGGGASLADGVIKVADFGLAQAVEASADNGTGHLMATAAYVAPELVTGGRADPRTDVYSAGIVLFEMLTGQVPYQGESPATVALRHVEQDVPAPSRLVPGVPAVMDVLVTRATCRDPGGRPTDAGAMHAAVQAAKDELTAAANATTMLPAPGQHTVVVPRIDPVTAAPTAMFGRLPAPGTGMPGAGERPPWARLPVERPAAPQPAVYPQHGTGRRQQSRHSHGQDDGPGLIGRVNADPRARLAVVAALVAVGLLVTIGGWWLGIGRYSTTPELISLSKADAVAVAHRDGFKVDFDPERFSDKVPKGKVLDQRPRSGERIVSGGLIRITLSRGVERYNVPDLAGKPYDLAENDLKQIGLIPKRGERYDDAVPNGSVVATEPAEGTDVKPGTEITVFVSKGRAPITVPNVIKKNIREARDQLEDLKLTVKVVQQDSDRPKDEVITQTPADGTGAEPGDEITLTVSNGPPFVVVPDVRDKQVDEAVRTLEGMGLKAQVLGNGKVRHQSPQPNEHVPAGTQISLFAFG